MSMSQFSLVDQHRDGHSPRRSAQCTICTWPAALSRVVEVREAMVVMYMSNFSVTDILRVCMRIWSEEGWPDEYLPSRAGFYRHLHRHLDPRVLRLRAVTGHEALLEGLNLDELRSQYVSGRATIRKALAIADEALVRGEIRITAADLIALSRMDIALGEDDAEREQYQRTKAQATMLVSLVQQLVPHDIQQELGERMEALTADFAARALATGSIAQVEDFEEATGRHAQSDEEDE